MACKLCGQTANQHHETCPKYKASKYTEEDLTEIARCPACTKAAAKMHINQFWCDTCEKSIYWCGKCCFEDDAKAKHNLKQHNPQTSKL